MSKSNISRRGAVLLTGGGMLGAAVGAQEVAARQFGPGPLVPFGPTHSQTSVAPQKPGLASFGADPHVARDPAIAFNPQFLAVVHIKPTSGWSFQIEHAHFAFQQGDLRARVAFVDDLISSKVLRGAVRFSQNSGFLPYPRPQHLGGGFVEFSDFRNFNFGSQHDIYFFFEHRHGEIAFDEKKPQLDYFFGATPWRSTCCTKPFVLRRAIIKRHHDAKVWSIWHPDPAREHVNG